MTSILILGGTTEAVELAAQIPQTFGKGVLVTTSLAGRVEAPGPVTGDVRVGGFGGAASLASYLRENNIDILIDATHPFASRISANARQACDETGVKRIQLLRPAWRKTPLDKWVEVPDMQAAADALPFLGRRVFMTLGEGGINAYAQCARPKGPKMWYLFRMISPPRTPLAIGKEGKDYEIIRGRGPFTLEGEMALLKHYRINVLVSKKSGGAATQAKIIAARQAGIPVVLLARPKGLPGKRAKSVSEVMTWLDTQMP